jgi:GntR family transcriptional regulator, transcriptional repressor for pyruvate dehydrogenase complex
VTERPWVVKKRGVLSYLEPLEQRTRGAAVLDALADMVDRAGLEIGDRLPPEVSLAEQLGVGRSTIREALNRWEGLGMIRRRRGDGTYLSARVQSVKGPVPTMIRLEGEALLRLIEVRRALECAVVQQAARNATTRQKAEISRLCDLLLVEVEAGNPWRPADAAFHGAIYESSGNPLFGQILQNLDQAFERSQESPFGRDEFGLHSFTLHRRLADAVVAGDPDEALLAVAAILDSVQAEVDLIISQGVR